MSDEIRFEGKVTAMEITRDAKFPHHIGIFRVDIEPIGLQISGIRVSENREGRISIWLPAEKRGKEWRDTIKLGPSLHGALKTAIFRELKERGLMPPRQDEKPLRYNPDEPDSPSTEPSRGWKDEQKWDDARKWNDDAAEPEADIPLPASLLNK